MPNTTPPAVQGNALVPSGNWRMLNRLHNRPEMRKGLDVAWDWITARTGRLKHRTARYMRRAERVVRMESKYKDLSEAKLREEALGLREAFRLGRATREQVETAFAVIREVAWREVGMKPYKVQVAAAMAMYHGCLVELATGEGKTLSATMPATVAGWRGRGVHVITFNDYLAARDAEWMLPVYKFCGLKAKSITGEAEPPERREGYLADVTYLTNKEAAADFLRDRLRLGAVQNLPSAIVDKIVSPGLRGPDTLLQRGLESAIIDEADSVLIDEAVTPLIISGDAPNQEQVDAYVQASKLAEEMTLGDDYKVNHRYREVELTRNGRIKLMQLAEPLGGIWTGLRRSEELVTQALQARAIYLRDKQYVVQEDKVQIVDEFTGRLMPDRTWRDGLHQAIEAKESLEVQPPKATLARVSFQRFFRLYKKLAGMTGTAWEGRGELWQTYKLPVVRIPTHRPCIRIQHADRIYTTQAAKWQAIVDEIRTMHAEGRAVLVGTRSVQASELLSEMLMKEGLEHEVLNAVRHAEEAQIVAKAGQPGHITVATNMAGRGTDIKVDQTVLKKGGLHVIATERHESGRVDRQLFGRTGRQGDPGTAVAIVSIEDELIERHAGKMLRRLARTSAGGRGRVSTALGKLIGRIAQGHARRQSQRQRKAVLRHDDWLDEFLGFAGRSGG